MITLHSFVARILAFTLIAIGLGSAGSTLPLAQIQGAMEANSSKIKRFECKVEIKMSSQYGGYSQVYSLHFGPGQKLVAKSMDDSSKQFVQSKDTGESSGHQD